MYWVQRLCFHYPLHYKTITRYQLLCFRYFFITCYKICLAPLPAPKIHISAILEFLPLWVIIIIMNWKNAYASRPAGSQIGNRPTLTVALKVSVGLHTALVQWSLYGRYLRRCLVRPVMVYSFCSYNWQAWSANDRGRPFRDILLNLRYNTSQLCFRTDCSLSLYYAWQTTTAKERKNDRPRRISVFGLRAQ